MSECPRCLDSGWLKLNEEHGYPEPSTKGIGYPCNHGVHRARSECEHDFIQSPSPCTRICRHCYRDECNVLREKNERMEKEAEQLVKQFRSACESHHATSAEMIKTDAENERLKAELSKHQGSEYRVGWPERTKEVLLLEAEKEIERLRRELSGKQCPTCAGPMDKDGCIECREDDIKYDKLEDEVKRLRGENERLVGILKTYFDERQTLRGILRREVPPISGTAITDFDPQPSLIDAANDTVDEVERLRKWREAGLAFNNAANSIEIDFARYALRDCEQKEKI
jgi:hypothetical protein